jgi:hypothetical protein
MWKWLGSVKTAWEAPTSPARCLTPPSLLLPSFSDDPGADPSSGNMDMSWSSLSLLNSPAQPSAGALLDSSIAVTVTILGRRPRGPLLKEYGHELIIVELVELLSLLHVPPSSPAHRSSVGRRPTRRSGSGVWMSSRKLSDAHRPEDYANAGTRSTVEASQGGRSPAWR